MFTQLNVVSTGWTASPIGTATATTAATTMVSAISSGSAVRYDSTSNAGSVGVVGACYRRYSSGRRQKHVC